MPVDGTVREAVPVAVEVRPSRPRPLVHARAGLGNAGTVPGGGGAAICTKWDTYPDGREFVGVGVIPDVEVYPTQAEVAAGLWSGGKDPVLDRGVAVLLGKLRER